jgi:LuxR family maltose regulon positive regulatory protein
VDDDLPYPREVEYLTLARVLVAQGRHPEASYLLARLLESAEGGARTGSVIEILILRALALDAAGQAATSAVDLSRAMLLAEPEGYIRIFADEREPIAAMLRSAGAHGSATAYTAKLLAAIAGAEHGVRGADVTPPARMSAPLAEALTEREREILRLLASGASNPEMARKLVVSLGTVKTHVHHILGKLNVRSRTKAIAKAKEMGLL